MTRSHASVWSPGAAGAMGFIRGSSMLLASGHAKNQSPAPMVRTAGSLGSSPTASEPQNQGWMSTAPLSGGGQPCCCAWTTSGWMAR
uniref:Uncharacterized protein n=1 Tax=Zea mays TaxID=4577 RepID=C4J5V4_MAIZE|nr:unknown [Zea mays]ACR37397.1 unknown [Zea mays]